MQVIQIDLSLKSSQLIHSNANGWLQTSGEKRGSDITQLRLDDSEEFPPMNT